MEFLGDAVLGVVTTDTEDQAIYAIDDAQCPLDDDGQPDLLVASAGASPASIIARSRWVPSPGVPPPGLSEVSLTTMGPPPSVR